jgi:predicted transcriptional regulator
LENLKTSRERSLNFLASWLISRKTIKKFEKGRDAHF